MKKTFLQLAKENFFVILLGLYPAALVAGTAVSEMINLILIISFLSNCYIHKNWSWVKDRIFLWLLIIYFYLVANSLFSNYPEQSYERAIGFIRFPILIFAISFVFKAKKNSEKIIFGMWFATLAFLIFDLYYEVIFGHNLVGHQSPWKDRLSGMMFEELKIAHLLIGFSLPTLFFIFESDKNIKKFIISIIVFSIILILTGERANTLKGLFVIFLSFLLYKNKFFQIKKVYLFFFLIIFSVLIYSKPNIHQRYYLEISNAWKNSNSSVLNLVKNSNYGPHYQVAWSIFQNYPIFGSGLKTFRIECRKKAYSEYSGCTTHPHQLYLEFLSEIGLVGFVLFVSFFVYILYRAKKYLVKNQNGAVLCSALYVFALTIPLLPSGSFFTSFGATIFWINIAIITKSIKE
jgi:O-antigen ligase